MSQDAYISIDLGAPLNMQSPASMSGGVSKSGRRFTYVIVLRYSQIWNPRVSDPLVGFRLIEGAWVGSL